MADERKRKADEASAPEEKDKAASESSEKESPSHTVKRFKKAMPRSGVAKIPPPAAAAAFASSEENRWDAEKRFKKSIISPISIDPAPSKMKKFTVWCSDGYDPDGWHSYQGDPRKDFDSTWDKMEDANARAEYLFFWKNSYGIGPKEVKDDDGEPTPETKHGLNTWTVCPADNTRWTVGVVPAMGYPHLPHATERRHDYDRPKKPLATKVARAMMGRKV